MTQIDDLERLLQELLECVDRLVVVVKERNELLRNAGHPLRLRGRHQWLQYRDAWEESREPVRK